MNPLSILNPSLRETCATMSENEIRRLHVALEQDVEELRDYFATIDGRRGSRMPVSDPKIPKGFVMVNMREDEKKELARQAKNAGITLRAALKWALWNVRGHVAESARTRKITGMSPMEQSEFFNGRHNN